jgi:hypothetical protein
MKNTANSKNLEWSWSPYSLYALGEDSPTNYPAHESDVCACGSQYCLDCSLENQPPKTDKQPLSYRFWLNWYRTKARVKALLVAGRDQNPWPK